MKKYLWLLLIPFLLGASPSRQADYITGEVITADDVESNEDEIFDYLQAGVEVYSADSVDDLAIDWGTGTNQVSQDDVVNGSTYKQYNPASVAITGGSVIDITDLLVADGGTGTSSLADGYVLLGSGTGAITPLNVTTDGNIIVGDGTTDPTTLTAFTSSTGTLKHESGGLEADVSGYTSGLYGQAAGVTANIDTSAEVAAAIGDETGTTLLVFNTSPTLVTPVLGAATATSLNASGTVTGLVVDTATIDTIGGTVTVNDALTVNGVVTATSGTSTNWNTAYTHSQDNTQAHTDYLLNSGDDTTAGSISMVNTIASGTVTGLVVSSTSALQVGSDYITDITGTNLSVVGGALTASGGSGDLLADGSIPLTADWDAGNSLYDITAVEFKGALKGQADTVATITTLAPDTATTQATQGNITSLGTLTSLAVTGAITSGTATSAAGAITLYDAGVITLYEDGDNFPATFNCTDGAAAFSFNDDVHIGADDAAENLDIHDAGILKLWELSDDFGVTLACNSGEAVATLTGGLDISGVLTCTSPALGTPSALVGTNISGTAANLTAGTVTTNANLTGEVTSVGNAATIADSVAVTSWNLTTPTITTSLSTDSKTITEAEIGRLDGLAGIIATDVTACTDLEGTGLSITAGVLNASGTGDMSYANTRFKVGQFDRDLSTATGTQAITSLGFAPSFVMFGAGTNMAYSAIAFAGGNAAGQNGISSYGTTVPDAWNRAGGNFGRLYGDANSKYQTMDLSSLDADGFTISWTKVSTPTGTAYVMYVAFK